MTYTFKFKRGPATQWTDRNPVLASGEPGFETDTRKWKVGTGSTTWNLLEYQPGTVVEDATAIVKGLIEIATLGEVASGTDSVRAVTPEGVRQERDALKAELLGGVSAPFDTLFELYTALGVVADDVDMLSTAVQTKVNAADVYTKSELGDPETDLSAAYTAAKA